MTKPLKEVLMSRDGLSSQEAEEMITSAREDLLSRIEDGEMPFNFMEDEFGLEEDYLMDLLD
jgi:hypothetical protein